LVEYCALFATGITHDVKNSNTSKNGAATELLRLMTLLFVETYNRKTVKFFVTTRCLMICKNEIDCSVWLFYAAPWQFFAKFFVGRICELERQIELSDVRFRGKADIAQTSENVRF
jgi:hypothetical protein